MQLISGVYWDKGKRINNEDSIVLLQINTRSGRVVMAAVSDGIGGLSEGENASGFMIEKLTENFYREVLNLIDKNKSKKAVKRSILRCLYEINSCFNSYADKREIQLGATLSLLLIWRRQFLVFHIGDSRIYRSTGRRPELVQITEDHRDENNRLIKCIGSFPFTMPDILEGRVFKNNGFLLCTDGFTGRCDEDALRMVLKTDEITNDMQIEKRLMELADHVIKRDEKDNMSAVYIMTGRR